MDPLRASRLTMSGRASPSGRQIEIRHRDQSAVIVEAGGGLRAYHAGEREILDGYAEDEMCDFGRGQVLLPWPNRLQDGAYAFDGEHHQLPIDEVATNSAIHGLVRWRAWGVAEQAADRVVMHHSLHPQPGYPFSLELSLEYALQDTGLSVQIAALNTGSRRCPFGAGAHPYLKHASTSIGPLTLQAPGAGFLRADGRGIPMEEKGVAATEYDLRQPRLIEDTKLDHAFCDLERDGNGLAHTRLIESASGLVVRLWQDESFPYLMLFTGDSLPDSPRHSLAVEPMTCAPNAFRSGDGLIVLEPGESFTGSWGISPT